MKKPQGIKVVETIVKDQLGLGDAEPAQEPETAKAKESEAPQLSLIQLLDFNIQNFLNTHNVPLFELVGLFELKVIELKEIHRLAISAKLSSNMAAQQNGNSH